MTSRIATCSAWGFLLDNTDVRYLVKEYLDKRGLTISRFKNNMPSKDWVDAFVKRNKETISHRVCQNIKPARAKLSPSTVKNTMFIFVLNLYE